jgi:hypothetical protein
MNPAVGMLHAESESARSSSSATKAGCTRDMRGVPGAMDGALSKTSRRSFESVSPERFLW